MLSRTHLRVVGGRRYLQTQAAPVTTHRPYVSRPVERRSFAPDAQTTLTRLPGEFAIQLKTWRLIDNMAEAVALMRYFEETYGPLLRCTFQRDGVVPHRYTTFVKIIFKHAESIERIPSTTINVAVPRLPYDGNLPNEGSSLSDVELAFKDMGDEPLIIEMNVSADTAPSRPLTKRDDRGVPAAAMAHALSRWGGFSPEGSRSESLDLAAQRWNKLGNVTFKLPTSRSVPAPAEVSEDFLELSAEGSQRVSVLSAQPSASVAEAVEALMRDEPSDSAHILSKTLDPTPHPEPGLAAESSVPSTPPTSALEASPLPTPSPAPVMLTPEPKPVATKRKRVATEAPDETKKLLETQAKNLDLLLNASKSSKSATPKKAKKGKQSASKAEAVVMAQETTPKVEAVVMAQETTKWGTTVQTKSAGQVEVKPQRKAKKAKTPEVPNPARRTPVKAAAPAEPQSALAKVKSLFGGWF